MFKFKKALLVKVVGLFLFLAVLSSLIPVLRTPVLTILKYPLSLFTTIQREYLGVIFYHRNMVQREELQKEVDILKNRLNDIQETARENARLRELFNLKQKTSFKVIAAQVVARSADNWASVIMINKGRRNGVRNGFVVINYLGLVGRVVQVQEFSSKVMLLNDTNMGVSAIISRSRQEGLVSGTLGNSLIMKYLPREADIQVADTIVTSGLTDVYPKGILIGTVVGLGSDFSGLSHYAVIKPAVDLLSIEEVLVIVP